MRLVRRAAADLRCDSPEVNVVLVKDVEIRALNRRFLKHDRATDVMSFPIGDGLLGEIYVSRDAVVRQAREYGVTPDNELQRLVLHGLLHLLGFTHRAMTPLYARYLDGTR